jgi:hypothetical protein
MIALFVALGGVSYGLAGRNTVTSDDLVNGQVKSKDIKNSGIKSKDIKPNGVKAVDVARDTLGGAEIIENTLAKVPSASQADTATNADNLGGGDPSSFRARWALVNADGTIAAQSGGISVVRNFAGEYYVNFGSSQTGKPISATAKWSSSVVRVVSVALCGGGTQGVECFASGTNNTNHVYVDMKDESGANVDQPFYIHVPASN